MERSGIRTFGVLVSILALLLTGAFVMLPASAKMDNENTRIYGYVRDGNNPEFPIDGTVTVKLIDVNNGDTFTTTTNQNGKYEFNLDEIGAHSGSGYFIVKAMADGYYSDIGKGSVNVSGIMPGDNSFISEDLQLKKISDPIEMEGTVTDGNGHGITGAKIVLTGVIGETKVRFADTTNSTGQYNMTVYGTSSIFYNMLVTANGYEPFFKSVNITGTTYTEDINLVKETKKGKWMVTGSIFNKDGEPVEATVSLIDMDKKTTVAKSDMDTVYYLQAYPGSFILTAMPESGYAPYVEYNLEIQPNSTTPITRDIYLKETEDPHMETDLVFSDDLTTINASYTWVMSQDTPLYGFSLMGDTTVRAQLDMQDVFAGVTNLGNQNEIGTDEYNMLKDYLEGYSGIYHMNTKGYVEVNGTYYNTTGDFQVNSIEGLEDGSAVNSTEPIVVKASWTYTAVDADKLSSSSLNVVVGDVRDFETVKLVFPSGPDQYEVDAATVDSETAKKTDVATVEATGNCDFMLKEKEVPEVYDIILKNSDGQELQKLSDGTTYIVKAGTDVKMYGDVFDSVDTPKDGKDTVNYTWTFNSIKLYGNNAVYNFTEAGKYNITLTATDTSGLTNDTYVILYVDDVAPTLQIDDLTFEPSTKIINEGDIAEDAGKLIINASGVKDLIKKGSDVQGEILSYVWTYDGKTKAGKVVELSWNEPGTYWVILNVTDMAGHSAELNITGIKVLDKTAPTIKVKMNGNLIALGTDQKVDVGNTTTFNASDSYDFRNGKEFNVTSFLWSVFVEGDNTTLKSGNKATFEYNFPDADKTYIVSLTVTDDSGNEMTRNITVVPRTATLELKMESSKDKPTEGDKITITVTVNNTGEAPAKDVLVTLTIKTGSHTDKMTKTVPEIKPNDGWEHKFTWTVRYDEKGSTLTLEASSNTASQTETDNLHLNTKKAEWPAYYYVIIIVVVIIVGLGVIIFLKRYQDQKLLEQRSKRKRSKSDEDEE